MILSIIFILLVGLLAPVTNEAAKVSDVPKLVELVEELNNPEDTNATITCSVGSGELQSLYYEWFKDKDRIFGNPNKFRIDVPAENYQSVLRIFNLKPSDASSYTCIARNRFGQDKISTKLNVKVQLKWISEPTNVQTSVGKMVHVPCLAEGNPQPRMEWRKLSSTKDDTEMIGSDLRFSAIDQRDAGDYECRASNGVEEDLVARIKIDVLGKYLMG